MHRAAWICKLPPDDTRFSFTNRLNDVINDLVLTPDGTAYFFIQSVYAADEPDPVDFCKADFEYTAAYDRCVEEKLEKT